MHMYHTYTYIYIYILYIYIYAYEFLILPIYLAKYFKISKLATSLAFRCIIRQQRLSLQLQKVTNFEGPLKNCVRK